MLAQHITPVATAPEAWRDSASLADKRGDRLRLFALAFPPCRLGRRDAHARLLRLFI